MKTFDISVLKPIDAELNATIFENKLVKIPKTLFFKLYIPFEDFIIDGQPEETAFRLDFIRFNIKSLRDLENTTYEFPVNPEEGYIDGSIYLFDVHTPVDVTRITFGKISNGTITATLKYSILFEYEATEYANIDEAEINLPVTFGDLRIDTDIIEPKKKNLDKAETLLSSFCDIKDFEAPRVEDEEIRIKMKV